MKPCRFSGLIVLLLFFYSSSGQSVLSTSFEKRVFQYAYFSDPMVFTDPFSQPFSLEDEISLLESLASRKELALNGLIERRRRFLEEDKVNTNGWISSELSEFWDLNIELSYHSKDVKLHYSLGSKRSYLNDTTFGLTYNKILIPVRSRSRLAYMSYRVNENTEIGIGRVPFNWSLPGSFGLMISDNPWPKDGYFIRHKGKQLTFEHFSIRLDDLLSSDIRDTLSEGSLAKRYLSAHRVEVPISSQFSVSFSEAILFGGQDPALLFQYLNPANVYFISKQADRWGLEEDKANPILGLDVLYTSKSGLSRIYLQLVVDDIDFLPELTAIYPNRYAIQFKVSQATKDYGVIAFSVKEVSYWMYTSFYTWGNFITYNEYLGNPLNGITEVNLNHQKDINGLLLSTDITYATYKDQNRYELFDYTAHSIRNNRLLALTMTGQRPLLNNVVANVRLQINENLESLKLGLNLSVGLSRFW